MAWFAHGLVSPEVDPDAIGWTNLVNVRSAGKDIGLEFGSFFPDADQRFPPKDHRPDVCVVMSSDLLAPLLEILRDRMVPVSSSGGDRAN
jgi:hypothetical protein